MMLAIGPTADHGKATTAGGGTRNTLSLRGTLTYNQEDIIVVKKGKTLRTST